MDIADQHPLLSRIPLTVSPFLSLPSATTLPYTYKTLSSTLPPSVTDRPSALPTASSDTNNSHINSNSSDAKPTYVISTTGHATHPDAIIASCQTLQAHLNKLEREATAMIQNWEREIKDRDLAEKRRVAPGWLDAEERILVPQSTNHGATKDLLGDEDDVDSNSREGNRRAEQGNKSLKDREGEELDRAFGGLGLK